jgi:hypothetical protein
MTEEKPMPKMNMSVPHQLGQDEALGRIQHLIADVREQHGNQLSDVHETWSGTTCDLGWKSMGMGMSATVQVNPSDVTIDSNMPMAFTMFKGKVEEIVRDRVTQALAPATA